MKVVMPFRGLTQHSLGPAGVHNTAKATQQGPYRMLDARLRPIALVKTKLKLLISEWLEPYIYNGTKARRAKRKIFTLVGLQTALVRVW